MKYDLLKKVNEPISFKGFKGVYLYKSVLLTAITLFIIIIAFVVITNTIVQISLIILSVIVLIYFLNKFHKRSKLDYYIDYKKKCSKNIFIKGTIIDFKNLRNG